MNGRRPGTSRPHGTKTTRRATASSHTASTSSSGRASASTSSTPDVIAAASPGSSSTIAAVLTEPWPLPSTRRFAARKAAEGSARSGPATDPICTQSSARPRSRRAVTMARMAAAAGRPQT